jgi:hypothetical protein
MILTKCLEKTKVMFKGEGNPFYNKKHTQEVKDYIGELSRGTKWWNNGKENRQCKECPGEWWVPGMYYEVNPLKGKKRNVGIVDKIRESIKCLPKFDDINNINIEYHILKRLLPETQLFSIPRVTKFIPPHKSPSLKKNWVLFESFLNGAFNSDGKYITEQKATPSKSSCMFCVFKDKKDICEYGVT